MAPSGRGIVRIAIEDFLETFDMSNVFENVLGKFGRFMFDKVLGRFVNLLDDIAAVTDIPFLKDLAATHSTPLDFFDKVSMVIGIIAGIILSMGNAYAAPYAKLVTYKVEAIAKSARLPISAIIALYRLYPDEAKKFITDYQEQGMTEARMQALLAAGNQELDLSMLITLYFRGYYSAGEYIEKAYKIGFDNTRAMAAIEALKVIPNVGDLIRMAVREAFSEDVVKRFSYDDAFPSDVLQYTDKQGLSKEWVQRYWRAHWELPSPNMGYEMLHRLREGRTELTFTDEDLDLLLRTADFAPYFRPRMKAISYQPVTRVDIRRIYKLGIFDAKEVKERYMDIGYNDKDAQVLADFTVKYEDDAGNDKRTKYKDLTLSVFNSLYKKGKLTQDEYRAKAIVLGYDNEEVNLLLDYLDVDNTDSIAIDYKKDFINDMTKSAINAYAARMIDKNNAGEVLGSLGINATDTAYMLQSADYNANLDDLNLQLKYIKEARVSGAISRDITIGLLGQLGISGLQQNKVIEDMELALKFRNRRLTEAQYRAAALGGIISQDDYRENLIGLGYTDYDIDILIALYFTTGA